MVEQKTIIIAEAGVNHNGDIKTAEKLIDAASDARADYIKFQTFVAEDLVSAKAEKADYQKKITDINESQLDMIKKLELSFDIQRHLFRYASSKKIRFLSSAFDQRSIDFLHELDLDFFKIPSGEITNRLYLNHIGSLEKPIVLSTGMATFKEIEEAVRVLVKAGTPKEKITVLHCNTEYPTPIKDVNLNAMLTIRDQLNVRIGYSDHTLGIEIPIAAVALGAAVIEKHLTLDRKLPGPDHCASLVPIELTSMIKAIRNIECALGDGIKTPSASELKNRPIARRSLVAAKEIRKGEEFSPDNVTAKRPGTGITPMRFPDIIGKKSKKHFMVDDLIEV